MKKTRKLKNLKLSTVILLLLLLLTVLLHPQIDLPLYCYNASLSAAAALGVGSAIAGLFGSLAGADSADNANRINQQNFKESLDFQKYQYQNLKWYNSALRQAQNARAAGLNPILAMQGLTSQGTPVSSPSANPQQPIDYSSSIGSAAQLGESLTGAFNSQSEIDKNYSEAAKNTAESTGEMINNQFRGDFNYHSLRRAGYDADMASLNLDLAKGTFNSQLRNAYLETTRRELENENLGLKNTTDSIIQGFLPTQVWSQISNTLADTELKLATKQINWYNARSMAKEAAAAAANAAKSNGFIVTQEQADQLANEYIRQVSAVAFNNWMSPHSSTRLGFGLMRGFEYSNDSPTYMGYYKGFGYYNK